MRSIFLQVKTVFEVKILTRTTPHFLWVEKFCAVKPAINIYLCLACPPSTNIFFSCNGKIEGKPARRKPEPKKDLCCRLNGGLCWIIFLISMRTSTAIMQVFYLQLFWKQVINTRYLPVSWRGRKREKKT